ncbi:MAG: di-heme oxidoredictase family protein, partial [Planctomycetota bacterium]
MISSLFLATAVTAAPPAIGERPAVESHLDQGAIDSGSMTVKQLREHGEMLFTAHYNRLDGLGRPGSTGTGEPRTPDQPAFIRTSGPESVACSACHHQPRAGGAGDFVSNVFVLAQALDPVTDSVSPEFSNERNTLGMFGSGPIEMLAREMSAELIAIREGARAEAANTGVPAFRELWAKDVYFGTITVWPDGRVDPSGIEGVDWDLIIKPFHQKGAVVSIRQFSNNAANHHLGMQAVERFGAGTDPDLDGVTDELTVGDMTAMVIFQATLATPGRAKPTEPERRDAA